MTNPTNPDTAVCVHELADQLASGSPYCTRCGLEGTVVWPSPAVPQAHKIAHPQPSESKDINANTSTKTAHSSPKCASRSNKYLDHEPAEPSPAVPEAPEVPKTQQGWIDFYRDHTAQQELKLSRAEATIAELVEKLHAINECLFADSSEPDLDGASEIIDAAISRATGKEG